MHPTHLLIGINEIKRSVILSNLFLVLTGIDSSERIKIAHTFIFFEIYSCISLILGNVDILFIYNSIISQMEQNYQYYYNSESYQHTLLDLKEMSAFHSEHTKFTLVNFAENSCYNRLSNYLHPRWQFSADTSKSTNCTWCYVHSLHCQQPPYFRLQIVIVAQCLFFMLDYLYQTAC